MYPKLSIITINYNNSDGLKQTIESVLEQTCQEFEYIVIDGGSVDSSIQHILAYQNRLKYWCSEKDSGVYNAMNKGIRQAMGEYLLFLNSGDFLCDNNVLEKVIPTLSGIDIVYGDILLKSASGETRALIYPDKLSVKYMFKDTIGHPASFIKRSLFVNSLYSEHFKIVSDWEFFLKKIIKEEVSYKHIHLLVSIFDLNGISSQNLKLNEQERKEVLYHEFSPAVCEELEAFYVIQEQPLYSLFVKILNERKFQKRVRPVISCLWKIYRFFVTIQNWRID